MCMYLQTTLGTREVTLDWYFPIGSEWL